MLSLSRDRYITGKRMCPDLPLNSSMAKKWAIQIGLPNLPSNSPEEKLGKVLDLKQGYIIEHLVLTGQEFP
jgi:hypothetical protein